MVFHWPQIVMICLLAADLGISLVCHGKPKGNYNFWAYCLATGITVWLLLKGGFFGPY